MDLIYPVWTKMKVIFDTNLKIQQQHQDQLGAILNFNNIAFGIIIFIASYEGDFQNEDVIKLLSLPMNQISHNNVISLNHSSAKRKCVVKEILKKKEYYFSIFTRFYNISDCEIDKIIYYKCKAFQHNDATEFHDHTH